MAQPDMSQRSTDARREDLDVLVHALYDVANLSRRLTRDDPVEPAAVRVLAYVGRLGAPRPSELASALQLDLSTVSRHVRSLENAGFLQTRPDQADRRAQLIALTAEGTAAVRQVIQNRCDAIAVALDDWAPEDRRALAALLRRLGDDLAANAGVTDSPPGMARAAS